MGTDKPEVQYAVIFRDSRGLEHLSLITAVHGEGETPLINLVFVTSDTLKLDAYGRATLHATSIRHASDRPPTGICWRWPSEELGPEPEPAPRHVRR